MADLERTWKVGELAQATGLTIRALHHYDEIGLLVPDRTESGHRVYSPPTSSGCTASSRCAVSAWASTRSPPCSTTRASG